jgi:lipid II:glycine glycyltransferase (peptidoglycan interpeptide bridge formation enzyme)
MLAAELVGKTKQEIKELILFNTKVQRFEDEVIVNAFEQIYEVFTETENIVLERQAFWQAVLQGLYGIDSEISVSIVDNLGSFEFIVFCETELLDKTEVKVFDIMYKAYHEKRESIGALIRNVLSAFIEDLSDIQPEEINKIMAELNLNLENLPGFIKGALK